MSTPKTLKDLNFPWREQTPEKTCVDEGGWVLVVRPILPATPPPMQSASARPQLWIATGESSCSSSCTPVIYMKLLSFSNSAITSWYLCMMTGTMQPALSTTSISVNTQKCTLYCTEANLCLLVKRDRKEGWIQPFLGLYMKLLLWISPSKHIFLMPT